MDDRVNNLWFASSGSDIRRAHSPRLHAYHDAQRSVRMGDRVQRFVARNGGSPRPNLRLIHIKRAAWARRHNAIRRVVLVASWNRAPVQAIRIIQAEHRALAAVLHGVLHIVREIRYFDVRPNYELLAAMMYYIETFPETLHHPKEELYLFKHLRARRPDAAPLLDRLNREHLAGTVRIQAVRESLARYRQDGRPAFAGFAETVAAYAAFHWEHARLEETQVLPLARQHLDADDWVAIDAAFTAHVDPLAGNERNLEFDDLFRRIVDLAPPPLGRGPRLEPTGRR